MQDEQEWVFLSPHLDDAVLSCGGLIWELVQAGVKVTVWTVFAGDPPDGPLTPFAHSLHARWGMRVGAAAARRTEDERACSLLGAGFRHLPYPDCIYRREADGRPVIATEEDLFRSGYDGENDLAAALSAVMSETLPPNANLAVAYGIGNHVDHQLVARAARQLGHPLWYYPDYPYATGVSPEKARWAGLPGFSLLWPVTEAGLASWQAGVAAYESQLSTFWQGLEAMRTAVAAYWREGHGSLLRRV